MPEERKLVTVLFADVTGSTALGEDLDPEDIRALMGRYYEHARRLVSDHGGTLEKFIGDAVMAVFGLPHAHGDDAERAVATALALRKAVENDSMLGGMMLRIGVNTGEVVATSNPSSGDFLVTGDAVNVAARLQQSASPGEVLIAERTRAATRAAFVFGDPRQVEVKGKNEPLQVFPVVEVQATREIERPPLVGRKRELAQLALSQSWAMEERRPQLVSIVAPAGTGKTRLLEEFLTNLDPDDGWRVAVGRCPPYGQSLTYWPLRGLLEDLVGGIDRDQVIAAFGRGGYAGKDASRLAHLVLAPLGIEGEGLTERESFFGAWRLMIETLAGEAPRIVVFEDLHWASESLLDLVEHVMQPRTQAPLLLISISRPELLDRRPTWGGGGRENFTALALKPLNVEHTVQLVDHLGENLPGLIRQRIVEQSGGNPFFATELVRSVAERGISPDVHDLDVVPDTVQAAVLARLDALSSVERSVMQAASVAGRVFRPATLEAMQGGLGRTEIKDALERLVARDLAVPGEGDAYTFRHVLIRDVAYGTLSRAERIRMHAAVAGWLEIHATDRLDQFAELIAFHYREAVTLAQQSVISVPLPFDPPRAVSFLERAGDLASRLGATAEACQHLQSAIGIAPAEEHIRLYEKLGDCAPGGTTGLTAYQKALDRWRKAGTGDPLTGARLLRKMLIFYTRWSPWTTSRPSHESLAEMGAEARRLAQEAGDEDEVWRVKVGHVFLLRAQRDTVSENEATEGRELALAAAGHFEERGDWASFSEALDAYTGLAQRFGRYEDAIEAAQRRLAVPSLPLLERGAALGELLEADFAAGRYDQCITVMREALAQVLPGESLLGCAGGLDAALSAAYMHGRWKDFDDLTAVADEVRRQQPEDRDAEFVDAAYWFGLSVAVARDDRAATEAIASALTRILALDQEESEAALFARGWIAAHLEDDPGKLDLHLFQRRPRGWGVALEHTLMFLSEHGIQVDPEYLSGLTDPDQAPQRVSLRLCAEIAQAVLAADHIRLEESIQKAERHGLLPHAARMRIVLAETTQDQSPLEKARPVLDQLEDRQALRRLEEVASSLR